MKKLKMLKSVNISILCPKCDAVFPHCINETELLMSDKIINKCPNCNWGIKMVFYPQVPVFDEFVSAPSHNIAFID